MTVEHPDSLIEQPLGSLTWQQICATHAHIEEWAYREGVLDTMLRRSAEIRNLIGGKR